MAPWRASGTSRLPSSGPSLSTWFGGPFEWRALGDKKNDVFLLLENLVKFGKFQQNLEKMGKKNMGCSNLNDLVKKTMWMLSNQWCFFSTVLSCLLNYWVLVIGNMM